MVNSISLDTGRYEPMLSLLSAWDLKVVALCLDDTGMPGSAIEVVERAGRLVEGLERAGIKRENIYIDPLIQPISTDVTKGIMAMEAIRGIMSKYPRVHPRRAHGPLLQPGPQQRLSGRRLPQCSQPLSYTASSLPEGSQLG
jgi:cobalamin-dependent methionine synthase I